MHKNCAPSSRRSNPLRAWGFATAACAAAMAMAGGGAAEPYSTDNLAAPRIAQIGEICRSVMGLEPGEEHFVNCTASLAHSAVKLDNNRGMQDARRDCLKKGLRPGDVALAECEVAQAPAEMAAATFAHPPAHPVKSLFYVSSGEIRRREQMACAQIGYDPIYGPFSDCVANLQGALFAADHPLN